MMQENTTNRNWLTLRARAGLLACTLFAGASFFACGEDAPVAANSGSEGDSAAAYAALSASQEACDDQQDECTTRAAQDKTALAACDAEAMRCNQQAQSAEANAQKSLQHDADNCRKHCMDADAGPGGDLHGCIDKHAPKLPTCVKELLDCLDSAGVRKGDATPKEIGACLYAAHTCFKAELQKAREARRAAKGKHDHPAAGAGGGTAGAAGSAAGAGGSGGGAPVRAAMLPPFWKR